MTADARHDPDRPDFDLTDDELRTAGTAKWRYPEPDVLPAWVAEMDVRPCPAVQAAVRQAVERGGIGYPPFDNRNGLPEATAGFLASSFGWDVRPERVVSTGDVMGGMSLALQVLCDPAPAVVPIPTYPPFLDLVPLSGRELVTVPCTTDGGRPALDVEAIEAALAAGARTVLLAAPHNPLGRAFDQAELGALAEAVDRHGARVISDEIHAPLVLPGATHIPYATVPGAAQHAVTVVGGSKAWNFPGLKCAQIVTSSAADLLALRSAPLVANHGTSPLGIVATVAAYIDGRTWLAGLVDHLAAMRELFTRLVAERLPQVRMTAPEATYLAWLDAAGTGLDDPGAVALAKGRVMVARGATFGNGYQQYVRVNLATSAERLERVVDRLALAWS